MKYIAACALLAVSLHAHPFSVSCALGAKCIKTQGTSIPSGQVIEMMERCDEFTTGGIGARMLKMSLSEIIERSGGNHMHPIYSAYYAFEQLRNSPLAFTRKSSVADTDYNQVAAACRRLSADFEAWLSK